jgi:hypothetical protein
MRCTVESKGRSAEIALAVSQGTSFTDLEKKYYLTKERVRQLALEEGLHAEDWRKAAREKRRATLEAERPWGIPGLVWDAALAHSLSVKRDLVLQRNYIFRAKARCLLIQDYRCLISTAMSVCRYSRGLLDGYGCHRLGIKERDFQIMVNDVPGHECHIFIVPWDVLEVGAAAKSFYLPLERRPSYKNSSPCINWWAYEDAWHLLKHPLRNRGKKC